MAISFGNETSKIFGKAIISHLEGEFSWVNCTSFIQLMQPNGYKNVEVLTDAFDYAVGMIGQALVNNEPNVIGRAAILTEVQHNLRWLTQGIETGDYAQALDSQAVSIELLKKFYRLCVY